MKTITSPHHSFTELVGILDRQQNTAGLYIIEEGGNEMNVANFISYPFRSDHFIILMQLEGTGHSMINFTDCITHKGQMLIIPANAIRQFFELPPECRFAALVFTSNFLTQSGLNTKYADMFDLFSSNQSYCIDPETEHFERLLKMLHVLRHKYLSGQDQPFDQQVINHLFQAFLFEVSSIYQRYNSKTKNQYTRGEDITMRFVKLLTDSFREERSVIFYAEQLHLTPRYLSQTVKEVTGRSAGHLIDEMVIIEAKAMLNDGSLSIAQVADNLYFSDQFFFSKYFKRLTGLSPSEYRKLL